MDERLGEQMGEMFGNRLGERLLQSVGERLGEGYDDWKYVKRINQDWLGKPSIEKNCETHYRSKS